MSIDTSKYIVRELLELLIAHGVKDVVCSPGSRNLPLLIAADARKDLRKHIVIDERSAGFVALGISQKEKTPVALICTSGTALLNYAPAAAEAFYTHSPLIVISADRPKEWIDQDDSQTIHQYLALQNFVKKSYDVDDSNQSEDYRWYANRIFNDALLNSIRPSAGPVHINLRLSTPLNSVIRVSDHIDLKSPGLRYDNIPALKRSTRMVTLHNYCRIPLREEAAMLAERLHGKKVMLIAGFMAPDFLIDRHVKKFASLPNVVVMAETLSNLHLYPEAYAIDLPVSKIKNFNEHEFQALAPDIVITIGGALVSRMLKDYLRRIASINPDLQHWAFGSQDHLIDCFKALTLKIESPVAPLLGMMAGSLSNKIKNKKDYSSASPQSHDKETLAFKSLWMDLKKRAKKDVESIASKSEWSDLKALNYIFLKLPKEYNLQLSNGTPVRYHQILNREIPHSVFCNRGVSGIEGSTSTAVGYAIKGDRPVLLISGDMSAAHDLGGLLCAQNLNSKIKIIIINNSGGGIFRFIESTSDWEEREKYLCADPCLNFEKLADVFGFRYLKVRSLPELKSAYSQLLYCPDRIILEIITPPQSGASVLKSLFI